MHILAYDVITNDKISLAAITEDICKNVTIVESIARIHEDKIFSLSHFNALVHAIIDTTIFLRYPIVYSVGILNYDFFASIRRATVNDYKFIVNKIFLAYDTVDSIPQSFFVIEIYCYYR